MCYNKAALLMVARKQKERERERDREKRRGQGPNIPLKGTHPLT
jgi:hypothetical protein